MAANEQNRPIQRPMNTQRKKPAFAWLPFVVIPILIITIAAMIPFYMAANSPAPSVEVGLDADTTLPPDTTAAPDTTRAPETTAAPIITDPIPEDTTAAEVGATTDFPKRTSQSTTVWSAINSGYAILIDRSTGEVVAEKNSTAKMYPASMTKIMTLIVAYENAYSLDDTFVMTEEIIAPLGPANASVAGFVVGETVTVRDMLYGAMLPSGADATDGLAVHIAGSTENFVALMNKKARELGLKNTHFVNASGLHEDDHYSTAEDIARIFEYALSIPECREIMTSRTYTMPPTPEHPEGLLMGSTVFKRFAEGNSPVGATLLGGKTGYTLEALQCLASLAVSANGTECILVVAHAETKTACIQDTVYMHTKYTSKR